jgi:hypothetical protein
MFEQAFAETHRQLSVCDGIQGRHDGEGIKILPSCSLSGVSHMPRMLQSIDGSIPKCKITNLYLRILAPRQICVTITQFHSLISQPPKAMSMS